MDATQLLGPAILFVLMILVGLQLVPDDFRRVMAMPRAVVGGTLGQIVLLPLMTWGLVSALGLSPVMSAGAILLASAPAAGLSNVMNAVARAHVALSVTLTAVSSVLAVISLPVLMGTGMKLFLAETAEIEVPLGHIVIQLVLFLLVPIALGMLWRARGRESAERWVPWANRFALVAIIALTALSAANGSAALPSGEELAVALQTAVLWTALAALIGWSAGLALRLDPDDRFTFLIEFGARNIALAFIVAVSSLGRLDLALFSGAYAMTGFPLLIGFSVLRGRRAKASSVT